MASIYTINKSVCDQQLEFQVVSIQPILLLFPMGPIIKSLFLYSSDLSLSCIRWSIKDNTSGLAIASVPSHFWIILTLWLYFELTVPGTLIKYEFIDGLWFGSSLPLRYLAANRMNSVVKSLVTYEMNSWISLIPSNGCFSWSLVIIFISW